MKVKEIEWNEEPNGDLIANVAWLELRIIFNPQELVFDLFANDSLLMSDLDLYYVKYCMQKNLEILADTLYQ